jgi:hypothetical protein
MEEHSEKYKVALLLVLKVNEGGHELRDECERTLEARKGKKMNSSLEFSERSIVLPIP